tara:strand:+ start:402 stop:539 length:138 start_codon:yes stop_codon:yes gene_type:complete
MLSYPKADGNALRGYLKVAALRMVRATACPEGVLQTETAIGNFNL